MVLCISASAAALPLSTHPQSCNGKYFPALISVLTETREVLGGLLCDVLCFWVLDYQRQDLWMTCSQPVTPAAL